MELDGLILTLLRKKHRVGASLIKSFHQHRQTIQMNGVYV
jgi:hypothetical protein